MCVSLLSDEATKKELTNSILKYANTSFLALLNYATILLTTILNYISFLLFYLSKFLRNFKLLRMPVVNFSNCLAIYNVIFSITDWESRIFGIFVLFTYQNHGNQRNYFLQCQIIRIDLRWKKNGSLNLVDFIENRLCRANTHIHTK